MKSLVLLTFTLGMITSALAQSMKTAEAQAEAVRLYPALGKAGTAEHQKFLEVVAEAKRSKDPALSKPDWPLVLANRAFNMAKDPKQSPPIAPMQLLGKRFADCDRLLGKPFRVSGPVSGKKPSALQSYKSSITGLAQISLTRVGEGTETEQVPIPEGVTVVQYELNKGHAKTLSEAMSLLGIPIDSATIDYWGHLADGKVSNLPQEPKTGAAPLGSSDFVRLVTKLDNGEFLVDWEGADWSMQPLSAHKHPEHDRIYFARKP